MDTDGSPNVGTVLALRDKLKTIFELTESCVTTRALLGYFEWSSASTKSEKDQVVNKLREQTHFRCSVCAISADGNPHDERDEDVLTFTNIQNQLFCDFVKSDSGDSPNEIIVHCPMTAVSKPAELPTGCDYACLVQLCCKTVNVPFSSRDNICLLRVDRDGWSVNVVDTRVQKGCVTDGEKLEMETEELEVEICALRHKDRIDVRRFGLEAVGPKYRIGVLRATDPLNPRLHERVRRLSATFTGFRKLSEDRNCYYRAVIFGLLEQVIESGNRGALIHIMRCFERVVFADPREKESHERLLNTLSRAHGQC
jgi:hypothetical protein